MCKAEALTNLPVRPIKWVDIMMDRRIEPRMLCADLVDIQWRDQNNRNRRGVANLEDISLSGACIQVERPVPLGSAIRITYPSGELTGRGQVLRVSRNRIFPRH